MNPGGQAGEDLAERLPDELLSLPAELLEHTLADLDVAPVKHDAGRVADRLRQGDPTVAVGLELDIIAAVIIGGASLSGGIGTVLGSMIGALIMAVLRNGSQQMGWPTYFQEIIIGLVIIVAVFLDRLRQGKAAA